jgi:hypothetical protein
MKNFLLFILILASKFLSACGYYPFGEDTRISLFNPAIFGYSTYSNFNYSASLFSPKVDYANKEFVLQNIKLWFDYCQGKVDVRSIDLAVYHMREDDINEHSQNEMIQYLYRHKESDALNYLRFAKNCESFNSWQEDPWERNTYFAMPKRTELMNTAIERADKVNNKDLKRRYTFLAIRLAWYNHHFDKIQSLFASVFEKTKNKDVLYYWSLYFKSITEPDSARTNFELAQVFANAVDKRFVCHQNYNSETSIEQALRFTQTKVEKANVYFLYGIEKPDKSLPYLQKMYALNPSSDGLSFLLLREINKIEDFVLTPYYTLFQPSMTNGYWNNTDITSTHQTLKRAERDRLYAKEVLHFVNSVNMRKVENPFFWKYCKAYLQFITRDYSACLKLVNKLEKSASNKTLLNQLKMIKALALTASQTNGSAIIPAEIQTTIIANQDNGQFVFAIGKELEYLGNTTDAAILYTKLDKSRAEKSPLFWKTIKNKKHSYSDYFVDYFDYTDVVYSPEQIQYLIDDIQKNKDNKSSFAVFKYEAVKQEIFRLYDLLGTKYIRQNKLEKAFAAFGKIDNRYLSEIYTAWRDNYNMIHQNPFYHLKYTPKFITPKDTIPLNKYTITKQLISYLNKAKNKNEKDRDYYYFLVANAYYNMGDEGNVPMMRRIGGWSRSYLSVIEDEAEFRQSNLAKKYFLLAKQNAKTDKFKALCLRMVIRCEKKHLVYKYLEDENYHVKDYDSLLVTNQYHRELQLKYCDYFDDLVSNCDNFETYFEARR